MMTTLQIFGLGCGFVLVAACVTIVGLAAGFYRVGSYRRAALEYVAGSACERLLDPGVLDAFLQSARREEVASFLRRVTGGQSIPPPAGFSAKEWQRLRELARRLSEARREPSETNHVDHTALVLLNDARRVADLKTKRTRLHDAMQRRIRDRVFASSDRVEIIRESRRWIAREERTLALAALRDVALPGIKRFAVEAKDPTGIGAVSGLGIGVLVLVIAGFVTPRPNVIAYLATGSLFGTTCGFAFTIGHYVRGVLRTEERPLVRAGIGLVVGGYFLCAATLYSLHAFGVKPDTIWIVGPFAAVEAVGLMLLGFRAVSRTALPD